MSAHRRRPQHSKGCYTTSSMRYVQEYEDPRRERPRYVPEDWQEVWARATDGVCRTIHRRWAYKVYPFDPQARDDLQDWLWVEACEFANVYHPKEEVDAQEHWEAALASVLTSRIRWHWAQYHGRTMLYTDEQGRRRAGVVDSIDAMIERGERRQTMHATAARINDGALTAYRPIAPERFVLLLEMDGEVVAEPLEAKGTCTEGSCTRPAAGRGLCTKHLQRAVVQWGKDIDQVHPTVASQRPTTCTTDGCGEPVLWSGLCKAHWTAARERCEVDGCENPREGTRLCAMHRKRELRTGTLEGGPAPTLVCTVEGCDRPHLAKGMCSMHYKRARKAAS